MPTFKSRTVYKTEARRRVATILPAVEKFATTSPEKCPPKWRPGIPLRVWIDTPAEERGSILRRAVRESVLTALGPMPEPAQGDNPPRPSLGAQPEPAPEPAPAAPASRYFSFCSSCGDHVSVESRRARVVFCSAKACAEARKRRV
ncbi:hypothetical protein [uncultured Arthrobacter sp.]|uniref:hypothetical protein n=1 Tax=uncultured Arthrobacter sp. TaxID=114050 RepID=UPI003217440C